MVSMKELEKMPKYLVSLAGGRDLIVIHAKDEKQAVDRAKGVATILDFMPSLPILAREMKNGDQANTVPIFNEEYFEMMGFTK